MSMVLVWCSKNRGCGKRPQQFEHLDHLFLKADVLSC